MVMTSAIKKSVLPLIVNRAIKKSWRKKKLAVWFCKFESDDRCFKRWSVRRNKRSI